MQIHGYLCFLSLPFAFLLKSEKKNTIIVYDNVFAFMTAPHYNADIVECPVE